MAKAATGILDTLADVDFEQIDKELADYETQITELQAKQIKLKAVRRALDVAKNGVRPRKQRQPKASNPKSTATASATRPAAGDAAKIKEYLTYAGASSVGSIAQGTGVDPSVVSMTCKQNPDLFSWNPRGGGWQLKRSSDD